jgi:type IV pilus assembly protein PilE
MTRGFTLVELLACLVVVALLTTLALPAWRGAVMRSYRADAAAALYALAAAQERYRLVHGRYADAAAPAPPVGLGLGRSERGWYELRVESADDTRFIASARPATGSPQARDPACRLLTINEAGMRGSAPGPPQQCWR